MLTYKHGEGVGAKMKGAMATTAKIKAIEDLSGTPHPRIKVKNSDEPQVFDLYLKIELEIGREFPGRLEIFGNLKRDSAGKIESWGGAFKIGELFHCARSNGDTTGLELTIDSQGRIPKDLLDALIGRQISYVRFVKGRKPNGKLRWVPWDMVGYPMKEAELLTFFKEKLKKDSYLRDQFTPEELDKEEDKSTSFNPQEFADDSSDSSF